MTNEQIKTTMSQKKYNELIFKDKVEVLKGLDNGKSARCLAKDFNCSPGQIINIKKRKKEIVDLVDENFSEEKQRIKMRKTDSSIIDQLVRKFFCVCRSKNISVSGPLLKERALEYARGLKVKDFHASEGWLDKFKQRHNIKLKIKKGECANVDTVVVDDWKNKLKLICDGYAFENIFIFIAYLQNLRILFNKNALMKCY